MSVEHTALGYIIANTFALKKQKNPGYICHLHYSSEFDPQKQTNENKKIVSAFMQPEIEFNETAFV